MRKVAILGKAASRALAPLDDASWEIWGVGTGGDSIVIGAGQLVGIGRWDAWMEPHTAADYVPPRRPWHPAHWEWLHRRHGKPIYTLGGLECPDAVDIPRAAIEARFGTEFLRNSVCWAAALALHQGVDALGLWGVDQASKTEYARERAGVMHFIKLAEALGVPVHLPEGCPLLVEQRPYPDCFEGGTS
jgi:hypothetical protein